MSHDTGSETHVPGGHADGAGSAAATGRSIGAGLAGTARFFAPSILVGLVAPFVFPPLRRAVKPVVKGVIKGVLSLSESVKEGAAEAREQVTDLLAEVRAEREQEAADSTPPSSGHA
jgi:hypothetical protein